MVMAKRVRDRIGLGRDYQSSSCYSDQRAHALAEHGILDVPVLAEIEHQDRHVVFGALGDCLVVHHPQVLPPHVVVAELAVEDGVGILFGIVAEDAVHAGGLQEDFGLQFQCPLGGGRVGGDERAAGAAGQDDDPALLQVAPCPAADVRLGHAVGADGRHQPGVAAQRLQGVLQGQAVDHRGQHAHVMGRGLVDARVAGGELRPAEDVAAADDDGDLHPVLGGVVRLPGDVQHGVHGDAALARMHESLAGNLQHHAPLGSRRLRLLGHRQPRSRGVARPRQSAHPTLRRACYSLGNSQRTNRTSFMPASFATWPTVFLSSFTNGCSARQHSA